ncbi:hypothetical protein KI387_002409, partial [Taxus chinensis]
LFLVRMDAPLANEHCVGIIHTFEEIEDSLAHKFTLDLWEREEKVLSNRINHKDTTRMSIQNEIYQLLALYFVLQGVVLTALFQGLQAPNQNTCKSWWIPFAFSALSFLATVAALHHKFREQLEIENNLQQEKQECRALFKCIQDLRANGALFDLNTIPISNHPHSQPAIASKVFDIGYWWGYRGAVTLILFAFSAVIFYSCWFVLCSDLHLVT